MCLDYGDVACSHCTLSNAGLRTLTPAACLLLSSIWLEAGAGFTVYLALASIDSVSLWKTAGKVCSSESCNMLDAWHPLGAFRCFAQKHPVVFCYLLTGLLERKYGLALAHTQARAIYARCNFTELSDMSSEAQNTSACQVLINSNSTWKLWGWFCITQKILSPLIGMI